MAKATTAINARKNLGQLLEETYYRGDEFIIERAGKPMAVLISVQEFERLQKQRELDFAVFDDVRDSAGDTAPDEVEKEVGQALAEIRKNA
jgi:prevent-host-death family protein